MKRTIKINFSDFWPGFNPNDNYLLNVLKRHYNVELSDKPDILFFSCYGLGYLSYKCHKVQFLAENIRPDFRIADFALSFDYTDHPKHLRLPLYVMYFDQQYTVEDLVRRKTAEEINSIVESKKKFCCFVVSNPKSHVRIDFFHKLSQYKQVDSGGRVLNNVGKPVSNKLDFVRDYKFIIAFENSSYPGYTTEKVLEPRQVNTIPIYWGNPLVGQEMNTRSFVNFHDYNSFDTLMEKVIEVDQNDDLYRQYQQESLFNGYAPNEYFNEDRFTGFFNKVIESLESRPVSESIGYKAIKAKLLLGSYQKKIRNKFHDWL